MSITTLLIFAGIPAAVILLVAGAVYAGSARRGKRYRPGRAFEFTPVWLLSAPEQLAAAGHHAPAIEAADRPALPASPADVVAHDVTGGASDRW